MNKQQSVQIAPLHKSIKVPLPPEEAFELFTAGIHRWWPLAVHSVGGPDAETCVFEGRAGGRIYERLKDGSQAEWGRVLVWQPYGEVQFSWHPGREPETAQHITLRFVGTAGGTQVKLEQTGWDVLEDRAVDTRREYDFGWDFTLARYISKAWQTGRGART